MFKYSNGFEKSLYWAKEFDEMAKKTMLRQLISKWGVMSIELEKAYLSDNASIREDGTPDFFDAPNYDAIKDDTNKEIEENANTEIIAFDTESIDVVEADESASEDAGF